MKYETFRCDVCGVICTNKCETINGREYCNSCLRNIGLEVWQ
jgi:hypothetical protein